MKKILIIAGPTASGKSDIAVDLALDFGGEIISCDSMQIYKYLDIGTAKVTEDEKRGVRHYMIDVVGPGEDYSVWEYSNAAKAAIDDITARGKLPIIVGGTGLYIESVIYPLNFAVNKDETVRARLVNELKEYGAEALHERLTKVDPEDAAKIHPNNTKRLIRALEIIELSGGVKPKSELSEPQYDVCLIALDVEREKLYDRIDKRVERMFDKGLEKEIKYALENGLCDRNSQSMQAIGYKEFFDYFDGKITLDEVKTLIKTNTRHYAKRQISWLKRYKFARWINPGDRNKIKETVTRFLRG